MSTLAHEMRVYEANLLYAISALALATRVANLNRKPPALVVYHKPVILAAPTIPGIEHEAVASAYIGVAEALAAGTGVWSHALSTAFHIVCVVAARREGLLPKWRPRDAADVLALDKYAFIKGLELILKELEETGRPRSSVEFLASPSLHKLVADVIVESVDKVDLRGRNKQEAAFRIASMVLWHLLEAAAAERLLGIRDKAVDVFGPVLDALEADSLEDAANSIRETLRKIAASVERRLH